MQIQVKKKVELQLSPRLLLMRRNLHESYVMQRQDFEKKKSTSNNETDEI